MLLCRSGYAQLLPLCSMILAVTSQRCLQEAGGADPPFAFDNSNDSRIRLRRSQTPDGVVAIVPTYTFNCCANVTEWRTVVRPRGNNHSGVYSVGFQVWRPSDTDSECYNQVGENYFPNVSLERNTQIRNQRFIREPVNSSDYITVQPGDVVGLRFTSNRLNDNGRYIGGIEVDETLSCNIVYHIASNSLQSVRPGCLFHIDDSSRFTKVMAAPMLDVTLGDNVFVIEEFPCPTSAFASITLPRTESNDFTAAIIPASTSDNNIAKGCAATASQTTLTPTKTTDATVELAEIKIVIGVAIFVAILLMVAVGLTLVVMLGILVCRKRSPGINKMAEKNLELPNPNYRYDGVQSMVTMRIDESDLYHEIGPLPQTADINDSTLYQQSLSQKDDIVNFNDEPKFEDVIYDELSLSNFSDIGRNADFFDEVGYYVPTLEERSDVGLNNNENALESNNKLSFFVEDQVYWVPANSASDLYGQLASKKYREIPRNNITFHSSLGSGQFGEVYKASWNIDQHKMELAVKTLKSGASVDDQVKFLQEAAIMGQFSHNNVIKMYGVVTIGEPVLLCVEILENGDLRSYLLKLAIKEFNPKEIQQILLKFAQDIAAGMTYLSKKCFVHRDLAARNILLNRNLTCKVADFGMARDLMNDTYYKSSGGQIPVKWTAPEALLYRKYSTDSDVWSYGMVLFEIWSVGKKPFANLTNPQVLRLLEKGYCQPPPPGCPRAIFQLMVDCWNPDHKSRPTFSDISQSYLQQPSSLLLLWSSEDNHISPEVGVCGAPLHEAERLYIDLQHKYKGYHKQ